MKKAEKKKKRVESDDEFTKLVNKIGERVYEVEWSSLEDSMETHKFVEFFMARDDDSPRAWRDMIPLPPL